MGSHGWHSVASIPWDHFRYAFVLGKSLEKNPEQNGPYIISKATNSS